MGYGELSNTQETMVMPLLQMKNIRGKPYITVSAKGMVNGLSNIPNDGADFGPDTTKGATAPGQYGSPYTETAAAQEAVNYAFIEYSNIFPNSGGPVVRLLEGVFDTNADITIPTTTYNGMLTIQGAGFENTYIQPGEGINCFDLTSWGGNVVFKGFSFRNQWGGTSGTSNGTVPSSFVKSLNTSSNGAFFVFENITFRIVDTTISNAALWTQNILYIFFNRSAIAVPPADGYAFNITSGDYVGFDTCQFDYSSGSITVPTIAIKNSTGYPNITAVDSSSILMDGYFSGGITLSGTTNILEIRGTANLFGDFITMESGAVLYYLDISHLRIIVQSSSITSLINIPPLKVNTNGTAIAFAGGVTPFALPSSQRVTTPSVPASGTAQENTNTFDVDVYIYGGTVTEIEIVSGPNTYVVLSNSTGLALSGQLFPLKQGDTITLTYTSAPTWVWR